MAAINVSRLSTQLHKWIGLIVAVQVLIWVGGGLVMVMLPIEQVRGEHHVAELAALPLDPSALIDLDTVARSAGVQPVEARLTSSPRGPLWTLTPTDGEPVMLSAVPGRPLPALTPNEARGLAQAAYRGESPATDAVWLAEAPQETGREGPLWRVRFDDAEGKRLYLDPRTGAVVSRRSDLWSFYDLMWRLHILDLEAGEDTNSPWLIAITGVTLVMVLTGLILLWIRLLRDWKVWRRRRA